MHKFFCWTWNILNLSFDFFWKYLFLLILISPQIHSHFKMRDFLFNDENLPFCLSIFMSTNGADGD